MVEKSIHVKFDYKEPSMRGYFQKLKRSSSKREYNELFSILTASGGCWEVVTIIEFVTVKRFQTLMV